MNEAVRSATAQDVPWVVELLEQAVVATPRERGGFLLRHFQRKNGPRARVESALEDELQGVFVATLDDHVVGFALTSKSHEVGEIEELFVDPRARGVGLGEGLLQASLEWSREQGCIGIELAVLPGDRNMKNACERAGLTARMLVMYKEF